MTGEARAGFYIGRIRREATGVANRGRVDAGQLPELAFCAAEGSTISGVRDQKNMTKGYRRGS